MNRAIALLTVALLLVGCTLTHYEARGVIDDTRVVLHWKDGDSAATVWRCGALPWPLTHGVTGHDTLQSDDGCVHVVLDGEPARMEALTPGAIPALALRCEGAIPESEYALGPIEERGQMTWFGFREPEIPDPCGD